LPQTCNDQAGGGPDHNPNFPKLAELSMTFR